MRVAVFNQKGGVGKTTTALNLAAAAARSARPVTLIDLDPQAHLTSIQGQLPDRAKDSIFAFYQDDRPLQQLRHPWASIGHLIPAHNELVKVDSIFGKGPAILGKLGRGLDQYATEHPDETIIIDCCPFLGVLSLNAVFSADLVVVPISTDFLALRGAQQIERTLDALTTVLKRRIERRYVLTRFDGRRKMSYEILSRVRDFFGDDVCPVLVRESVDIAEAPSLQRDVFTHAPRGRGAADYESLYQTLFAAPDSQGGA